ncbi:nitrate- and nitrite sensing domain-containing protein [Streptomyces sp. NBC_01537]|uniref:nitrate- and nitrite sensing domain-containing protein n=1 Tax=Streptomyces sp. NBC_01537 TaxID=2903896 RepID=UPI00386CF6B1
MKSGRRGGGRPAPSRPAPLARLRVGRKLALLVMLPLGALLLFTVLSSLDQLRTADQLRDFRAASRMSFVTAAVADALARERTAAVLERVSPGTRQWQRESAARARATDRALDAAMTRAAGRTGSDEDIHGRLLAQRNQLLALRVQTAAGAIGAQEADDRYSSLVREFLEIVGVLDSGRPARASGQAADAYLAILAAIEAAEHERTDLAVVFAEPTGERRATASQWENLEAAEFAAFNLTASQRLRAELKAVLYGPAGRPVQGLRDDLATAPGPVARRATLAGWLDMSGDRIASLRALEREAAGDLETAASQDLAATQGQRRRDLDVSLAVLVAVVALAVVLSRSITRPLAEVSAGARTLSGGDLDSGVRYTGRDEIGEVAEAFRGLRVTAGRLAGEIRDMNTAITGGQLGHRADVAAFEGTWSQLLQGMNGTMAAFAGVHGRRRKAELELEGIFNLSLDLLCIGGSDGYFKRVNPAFERTLGYTGQELLARPFIDFVHPDDRARTLASLDELARGEAQVGFENRYLHRDRTPRWLEWNALRDPDGGLIYAAARDITERRRAERELARSRARVVAAADEARRRIERDLHDGVQQRLVSLGLELRVAETMVTEDQTELRDRLSDTLKGLTGALDDLLEISRGIHPAILSRGGLGPALRTLARRSAVPAEVDLRMPSVRLPDSVEVAAYYVVSEALTNAAKHAHASLVRVRLEPGDRDGTVELEIRDDGIGGARTGRGSGLIGLTDRVEALGGRIRVESPPGSGTALFVTLPVAEAGND